MGRCNISTFWVNKSGSDANNGSTALLAKLTILGAYTAAASNDTIVVGSGIYNERLGNTTKSLTFLADGIVIIDGTGFANLNFVYSGNFQANFRPYTTGGWWVFQNWIGISSLSLISGQSASNFAITLQNAVFINCIAGAACTIYNVGAATISNCIFGSGFVTPITNASYSNIQYCTFYNALGGTTVAIDPTGGSGTTGTYVNNIIQGYTTAISIPTSAFYINQNLYYNNTNLLKIGATTYTTLHDVQALGYELNGVVGDPHFADPTNNIFYLTQQRALFPNSPQVGAYPYGFTRGANNDSDGKWHIIAGAGYDNTGWYNPDGNVTKNGTTGNLELSSGTSGVVWSPVIDTGIIGCKTTELDITAIQVWPTNMVDYDISDVRPNYQTVEVRASDGSFAQNDAVIAWTVVKSNMAFTAISGRYLQCRITMRSNDVQS